MAGAPSYPRRVLVVVLTLGLAVVASGWMPYAPGRAAGAPVALGQPAPTRACGKPAAASPGAWHERFVSVGRQRDAVVEVPGGAGRGAAPLLLAFHGSGGDGPFMRTYSGFGRIASKAGFVGVYPTADGPRWNLEESEDPTRADDVRFIRELIDRLGGHVCFDKTRVYAVGVSNGGGFAALLACRLSHRIAAVASVAGGYGDLPGCAAERPVSVLEIHGTEDDVVPYDGRDGRGAAREFAATWAARDGCPPDPREREVRPDALRYDWRPCRQGAEVSHMALVGGQHQWPGAIPADPGPVSSIDAAAVIWRFIARHRLATSDRGAPPTPVAQPPARAPAQPAQPRS